MRNDPRSPATRELRMEKVVASPLPDVWAAWTTEPGLARWWWNHWADVEIDVDARVGGAYRFAAPHAGIVVTGTYLEVVEPTRLVFTWEWRDADGVQSGETVEVDFVDVDGATVVALVHRGPWAEESAADSYRQGWAFVLDALARAE
jgi:uncharacterized protein YndB with AHSA1/START domain